MGCLSDVNRLRVSEFFQTVRAKFASEAGLLYAAEGQARIGAYEGVHETTAGVDLVHEFLCAGGVVAEY